MCEGGPQWGSSRAHRLTCKNALAFSNNTTNTMCTILIDYNFATKPSPLLSFATERSTPWLRTPMRWPMTLATSAGQPGPSPPYLPDRCSPRCRRESMGGEEMSRGAPRSSLCGDDQPTMAATRSGELHHRRGNMDNG